jgi:hypothetical protein
VWLVDIAWARTVFLGLRFPAARLLDVRLGLVAALLRRFGGLDGTARGALR